MTAPAWTIRDEAPADAAQVFRVDAAAFGRPAEAKLVDALRPQVRPFLSLVAEARGFHYVSEEFDASFQVIQLEAGALDGQRGVVRFPPAFDAV